MKKNYSTNLYILYNYIVHFKEIFLKKCFKIFNF